MHIHQMLKPKLPQLVILFWLFFMVIIFSQMLIEKPDGLYAGHPYVWSDWALHIGLAQIFATKDPWLWFYTHPLYAGGKLTYGFLTNLISGLLMKIGLPITFAFNFPSVIYAIFLVLGLYFLGIKLTKSKTVASLAICIFFLSSGLGFLNFGKDFIQKPSLQILLYPPIEYSKNENFEWGSGNVLVGMLVPQRAFLMGLTIAVWSLNGFLYGLSKKHNKKTIILIISGLMAGILPITHMHSFIAIAIICLITTLYNYKAWKKILWYCLPAIVVGSILYLIFISGGIKNPDFMQWFPGWTAKNGLMEWISMWWQLWGLMLPTIGLTIILWKRIIPAYLMSMVIASSLIFILANLILFQPIHWDNSKLFLWAYLGFSYLAAYGIIKFWLTGYMGKFVAITFFCILTATGTLELIRLYHIDRNTYQIITRSEMQFAEKIRQNTDPKSIFATASSHNHPVVMWAARPIVLGYTAWVWNFGFLYQEREQDLRSIYNASHNIGNLLNKYNISYVYIGQKELEDYSPNVDYFTHNYPIAFRHEDVLVFDVRSKMIGK